MSEQKSYHELLTTAVRRNEEAAKMNVLELIMRGATEEHARTLDKYGYQVYMEVLGLLGDRIDARPEPERVNTMMYLVEHIGRALQQLEIGLAEQLLKAQLEAGIPIKETFGDDPDCDCPICTLNRAMRSQQAAEGGLTRH